MTIPPLTEEAETSRNILFQFARAAARLQTEFHVDLAQLSMGDADFAVAVEEGARWSEWDGDFGRTIEAKKRIVDRPLRGRC